MATHLLWSLLNGLGSPESQIAASYSSAPPSGVNVHGDDSILCDNDGGCSCSVGMRLLRALHIEGLPPTISAADLSTLMTPYGTVQYAEAALDAVKNPDTGDYTRKLHCYVVFTDHQGACQAKRVLQPRCSETSVSSDALRVRFCRPQNVVPLCTPTLRAFIAAQWAQSSAAAKASPDYRKASCKVNALFISKLHQHITTARLSSLFGKFGKMLACEVQYHSDGRSAGHGVVIYETIDDAEKALASTNGYRLEGRTIEVTPLRLKKLPSKLEHLKNRIKRQPLSDDISGSEDGSGSIPACSPKSMVTTPVTPASASVMGLTAQQQQAAAAALQLQHGLMQGLQLHQQQMMLQQLQQQFAMQQMGMGQVFPGPCGVAAAAAGWTPCSMMGVQPAATGMSMPGLASMSRAMLSSSAGVPLVRPSNDGVVPPGLDLSFI